MIWSTEHNLYNMIRFNLLPFEACRELELNSSYSFIFK